MDKIKPLPPFFHISKEVSHALGWGIPVVALESTLITHGLPHPENLDAAHAMEAEIRQAGAVPATIAVLEGKIRVGLAAEDLDRLVSEPDLHKISTRDIGRVVANRGSGGTTVAGTMQVAHMAGIRVFATGGIGGVHRGDSGDVSADLPQLANTPMIVVCAGAKAILDLPATVEYLETHGIPVVGFRCDQFPAFYSQSSGLPVSLRLETAEEVARLARIHWELGLHSAILVTAPPPEEVALPVAVVERAIDQALEEAAQAGMRGQMVTPFLLERVSQLTGGESLRANLDLLRDNARLAALIADKMAAGGRLQTA